MKKNVLVTLILFVCIYSANSQSDLTVNSLFVKNDMQLGTSPTSVSNYGKKLYFGLPGENDGDALYIARFNASSIA